MINRFLDKFKKPIAAPIEPKKERPRQFSTDSHPQEIQAQRLEEMLERTFSKSLTKEMRVVLDQAEKNTGFAMDSSSPLKRQFVNPDVIPQGQLLWYANQTFLGYQICAMLSQNWLISKCCLMPAEDSTRNGYEVTVNDGNEVEADVLDEIRKADVKYHVNKNLIQFLQMGRIFGIRIAMFKIESEDSDYYYKPFNPDGVTPGSYKGISQIDPYWITPQLDTADAGDPSSINFYEPTWWNIAGKLVHRTHLIVYRTEEVPDVLKPTYVYGGIPIPQKIVERVYAAERTANEAPMLALTKRTDVINVDLAQATANEISFAKRIQQWVFNRDNYGIKALGLEEKMQQFDTTLTDLDAVIMTQYQLVAAAANVPSVKLLGTSPKGFNTTGEFEESNYHEMLESLQTHALTPLLERHHLLLIRSEIAPKFNIEPFNTTVTWKPLDAMTAKELAELNKMKAETGGLLMNAGAIDGMDERQRVINDPESGYTGLVDEMPIEEILSDPNEG
jgi:phage-related protein (TIGR01555 family)